MERAALELRIAQLVRAGDWPESWRAVQIAFARFAAALEEHERSEAQPHREP